MIQSITLKVYKVNALRFMACLFIAIIFTGCGSAVQYTLSADYDKTALRSIAVLPVRGGIKDADVRYLFRTMAQEKLTQMGYAPLALEVVDDKLLRKGIGRDDVNVKTPKELAEILDVDAVVYTTITEWDTTLFLSYASIQIGAKIELYYGASGDKLWDAEFNAADSDMSLERGVMELGIVKAYEPVIQRIVDAVFSPIPANKVVVKAYYDWLP